MRGRGKEVTHIEIVKTNGMSLLSHSVLDVSEGVSGASLFSKMESTSSPLITDYLGGENFSTEIPFFYGVGDEMEDGKIFFSTPEDMLNPSMRNPAFYPIVITHAITFVLGIFGNVVAVSVMIGDRKGRNATNLFLVSLAVADLLLLLLCIPLEVLQYFLQFEDNGVICKVARYTELLSASASVLNLCAVSLERFIVIVFPMRSRSVCTLSNCRKAICVVWVLAVVLSLPVMLTKEGYSVTYTNNITSVSVFYCKEVDENEGLPIAIYKFAILFAAPALLMMICYVYVIKMLILIIILFLVCWGPKLILTITLKLAFIFGLPIYSQEVYVCRVAFSLIPFVHSCINPIVYSFMSKNFRRSMNRQLGRCCVVCGCKCNCNNCGNHRNSIPLRSTARARTTQAVESTYSSNYCQLSDVHSTRHTEIEGISTI
ncbi:Galanin receptor type 2 [Orchesella cincta]|uniref:Galanin receptor type 2 n=1 Tax=Orchesella cincta TaxID=48709 RepID=A0A1D2NBG9_ORCCI|nr:Galanin receptor type 2 [Orchesella cincta]